MLILTINSDMSAGPRRYNGCVARKYNSYCIRLPVNHSSKLVTMYLCHLPPYDLIN
jgi:hypothetical protein